MLRFFVFAVLMAGSISAAEPESPNFKTQIQPLLSRFCYQCHNEKDASADVNLQALNPDLINGPDAETWHDALNRLNLGEMPPEEKPQPSAAERKQLVDWITRELKHAAEVKRNTGGQVVLRRLTRYEYANTMRDLLGVNLDFAADLPPEPTSPDGFQNNGATLGMSPIQLEYYLKAARLGLSQAIVTGEQPKVISHQTAKTSPVQERSKKNLPVGNQMPPGGLFQIRLTEFPREGEFRIRIKAGARTFEDKPIPRLSVSIGLRSDVLSPMKLVGTIDVEATLDDPQVYELKGRIEQFPLPGENPKYPGLLIRLEHVGEAPPGSKGKKNKRNKKEPIPIDPNLPMIEIESVDFEGPIFDAWPPASHTRILFGAKDGQDETQYARDILDKFMTRAFRRPVRPAEVDRIMTLFPAIQSRSETFEQTMREVLAMVLISPDFLYLVEPRDPAVSGRQELTDYELASRLSYFLWSTMPDETLLAFAKQGKLRDPAVLQQQIQVMLEDERSQNFVTHFTDQWLDLSGLDRVAVNPEFYPKFDDALKPEMRKETQAFFAEILRKDLDAWNLIDSDFTMLNRPLAEHYGIPGPKGSRFERVTLPAESPRGGLLTQAGILLANSTGEDSHPIRRAVWILDRLLDDPPAPPPPDVPELKTDQPDFAALPLKKQLELHREKTACMNCHQGIDPWGIPLENFDAVGQWRTEVIKPKGRKKQFVKTPVDSTSTLPGQQKLAGVDDLKQYLMNHEQDRFSRAVVSKLMAYALGRSPELSDQDTIEQLAKDFSEHRRFSKLIVAIVQSDEFQTK